MSLSNPYSRVMIDLAAIQKNYLSLRHRIGKADCAVVLKANAYGLGVEAVAPALYGVGCRHFFVAYKDEAVFLKQTLAEGTAKIYVLNGPYDSSDWPTFYHHNNLIPVLNTLKDLEDWHSYCRCVEKALPTALHINTHMHRLGLPWSEYQSLDFSAYPYLNLRLVMSHLSCAEDGNHPANLKQLRQMRELQRNHPKSLISLANSGGIFLGSAYHFDMVRPGVALYGLGGDEGSLSPCLTLQAQILQIQEIQAKDPVGYGETFIAQKPMRLACLAIGYGDGVPWRLAQNPEAHVWIDGQKAPIVGRVSMDLMTVDVTNVSNVKVGDWATLLNNTLTPEVWSGWSQMIHYEILLNLGDRVQRVYTQTQSILTAETALC